MALQGQAPPCPAGPLLPSSRRRAVVQGLYFRDTQCSGSLYTESWGDKRIPRTSLGPGVPGQPHRGLLQPLLAALPALPAPACPPPLYLYSTPFPRQGARHTPSAGLPLPATPWQTQATPSPSPHAPTRPLPLQSELWTHAGPAGASPRRALRASPHPMERRRPANTSCLALPGSCLRSTSPNPKPLTEQQRCPKWSLWGAGMGTAHLPARGHRQPQAQLQVEPPAEGGLRPTARKPVPAPWKIWGANSSHLAPSPGSLCCAKPRPHAARAGPVAQAPGTL